MIPSHSSARQPLLPGNEGPYLMLSAHGGRILAANEASAHLTGYSSDELTTLRLGDLLGRQEYSQTMAFLEQSLMAGGGELKAVRLYRKDGSPRSVALTVKVLPAVTVPPRSPDRSPALHCSLEDITEQERIGQELQEGRQVLSGLRTLADTINQVPRLDQVLGGALKQTLQMLSLEMGGIYLSEQRDQDGSLILRASQGIPSELMECAPPLLAEAPLRQRLKATMRGELSERGRRASLLVRERVSPSSDLLLSPWQEAGLCAFMALSLGTQHSSRGLLLVGETHPHHFTSRDKELLELSSLQLGMAVENGLLLQELAERIQDLWAMRQFSVSVLRDMSDGLLTVDAAGRITTFNPAAEVILSYPASQAQGESLASLLGADSELVALVQDAMSDGSSHVRRDLVVRRGDGRPVPVGASVALLQPGVAGPQPGPEDEGDQATGAVVVFADLTEEKKAEEERQHQDRLALLGEMTAVLAHEVRNPLAGVVHGVQYMAEELTLDGELAQCIRLILEDSRRISRLLDDILLISRPQQFELVPCDLPAILERLLRHWRARAAARGVEVRTSYAENLGQPLGDPARLEQVFVNLISNALDAMPEGGTLQLRVRPAQLASSLPGRSPLLAVQVEVEDTGIGIPAHALQRVFEPFFTTREKGTGLGLAIARRIVRDHQGKLQVHSEEGKGTCFTVTLPLGEE
mgnify:CR=1 FL=1